MKKLLLFTICVSNLALYAGDMTLRKIKREEAITKISPDELFPHFIQTLGSPEGTEIHYSDGEYHIVCAPEHDLKTGILDIDNKSKKFACESPVPGIIMIGYLNSKKIKKVPLGSYTNDTLHALRVTPQGRIIALTTKHVEIFDNEEDDKPSRIRFIPFSRMITLSPSGKTFAIWGQVESSNKKVSGIFLVDDQTTHGNWNLRPFICPEEENLKNFCFNEGGKLALLCTENNLTLRSAKIECTIDNTNGLEQIFRIPGEKIAFIGGGPKGFFEIKCEMDSDRINNASQSLEQASQNLGSQNQ